MSVRLFISQDRLDRWLDSHQLALDGNNLSVGSPPRAMALEPALLIRRIVSEGSDHAALIGRVKTARDLDLLGAELIGGSAILGETVYEGEAGFVGLIPAGADLLALFGAE